jgi:hypothetical protein
MVKGIKPRLSCVLLAVLLAACSGASRSAPDAPACDRSCLEGLINQFLTAMAAHDASALPVNEGFVYVENNQALPLGTGSWQTLQSFGSYRHYFADPEAGQAAIITTMRENNSAGLFTLRIKAENGKLSEAEAIITHDPRGADNYEKLKAPASEWLETVAEEDRMSRDELAVLANKYFGSMENNDGKGDYSFFGDDCDRLEHGLRTTNNAPQKYGHSDDREFVTLDCRGQFETGFLGFVTRIRDRRYEVIDVERGAVFSIAAFDHDGTIRNIALTNGKNFKVPSYFSTPRSLQVGEAFRARDGHIQDIEMTLHEFPYGQRMALRSTFVPSSAVPDGRDAGADAVCQQACVEQVLDQLLTAFTTHKPQAAPLAGLVRYIENDQVLAVGDGLWGTLTAVGNWQVRLTDIKSGTALFMGRVVETDINSLLTLRIKLQGDRISQIEAQVVRDEKPGAEELFRALQPTDPQAAALKVVDPVLLQPVPLEQRAEPKDLVSTVQRYFDALEGHNAETVAFSADCSRHDNGLLVTNNPDLPPPAKSPSPSAFQWRVEARGTGNVSAEFKPYALPCGAQLASGYASAISAVRDRRVLISDAEHGLVVIAAYYDMPGTRQQFMTADGVLVHMPAVWGRPRTLATRQMFKIEGGAIRRIETFTKVLAYGARPLWPAAALSPPPAP